MNNKLNFTENFEMVSTEELKEIRGGMDAYTFGYVCGVLVRILL